MSDGSASDYTDESEDEDAQELANRVMDDGDSSEEEGAYQVDGLRHMCVLDATPLDEAAMKKAYADSVDTFERALHQSATTVSNPLLRETLEPCVLFPLWVRVCVHALLARLVRMSVDVTFSLGIVCVSVARTRVRRRRKS